ncbi:MAG TPA: hypothetical protein VFP17_00985 [Solirubrobacterales bacterium]|nr:hypothetical protein [Solirubrobacterales bacterium]
MNLRSKLAAGLAVLAMGAVPSVAGATGPEYAPEHPTHPTTTPKGHAYGYYCKGKSKKHVKGVKGTEFSNCVHTLKQADNQELTPKQACKEESKEHVKGVKGTDYSNCVKTVAHMQRDQRREEREQAQV